MLTYYQNTISSLLMKVQRIRAEPLGSQDLCLEIQETLIRKISYFEKRIRFLKAQIKSSKQLLRTKKSSPLTKSQAAAIKSHIEDGHYLIDQYQRLQFLFRTIGDALAFIYLDTWDIKPLAFKESPGAISGKKGARLERRILRGIVRSGYVAILNDLTNCLRYGDITVVQDGFPQILEVKSGKAKDARSSRQIEDIRKIQEYLVTDQINGLYRSNINISRSAAHSKAKYHRDKLNRLIDEALIGGRTWTRAESGVYYLVETPTAPSRIDEIIAQCDSPPIVFYLNAMKYSNVAYYPFSLSIESPDAFLKFYMGDLFILVLIDPAKIYKQFAVKGLAVSINEAGDYALTITAIQKSDNVPEFLNIGKHMFWRVPFEFMSLNWLMDEFIYSFLNFSKSSARLNRTHTESSHSNSKK